MILLLGFKVYIGGQYHLQAVVNNTESNLKVSWWLEILNGELGHNGYNNGSVWFVEEVKLYHKSQYKDTFVYYLSEIQQELPDIIMENIDVVEGYGICRSFWRGS